MSESNSEPQCEFCTCKNGCKKGKKIPAWLKPGAYVVNKSAFEKGRGWVMKISDVDDAGRVTAWRCSKQEGYVGPYDVLAPVTFRPYSFAEGRKLLGDLIEYESETEVSVERIHRVQRFKKSGNVAINGLSCETWQGFLSATINGAPFGVPVIDEEALKEASDGEHEL